MNDAEGSDNKKDELLQTIRMNKNFSALSRQLPKPKYEDANDTADMDIAELMTD